MAFCLLYDLKSYSLRNMCPFAHGALDFCSLRPMVFRPHAGWDRVTFDEVLWVLLVLLTIIAFI